jgi:hypothetical protein
MWPSYFLWFRCANLHWQARVAETCFIVISTTCIVYAAPWLPQLYACVFVLRSVIPLILLLAARIYHGRCAPAEKPGCVRRSDDGCHLETITSSGCISCYLRWIVCENSTLFFQQTFVCSIYFYVGARRRKCLLFGLQPEISFNRIRKRFSSRWQTLQKSSPPRAVIIQMREKEGSSLARQAANQKFLIHKNKGSIGVRPQYAPPRALTL